MWKFKRIIQEITGAGVTDAIVFEKQYRLKSMNALCLIGILIMSPYYFIFSSMQAMEPMLVLAFFHLCFFLVLVLNFFQRYNAGNYLLIFATNVGIVGESYYIGFHSGFHLYFLTGPLFIFWIFDWSEKRLIASAIALELAFVGLTFFMQDIPPVYPWDNFKWFNIYYLNLLLNLFLTFLLFYNYTRYHQLLTDSLVQKQESLQDEIERRRKSEEYTSRLFQELSVSYKNLQQFSYIISHNVRSPLSNIKGFLSIYEPTAHAENDQAVDSIREAANHLDEVIMDLNVLLSAKNLLQENRRPVNLSEAIKNVSVSLAAEIQASGSIIREEFPIDLNLVTIKTILHSILFNLFQNAIRYSKPDTYPEIIVKASSNEAYTEIAVSDNGRGIDLERYNDRVFMLYNTFGEHKEGRGIGLFLVRSNVEMLGGSISVKSKVNEGSTFTIQFKHETV